MKGNKLELDGICNFKSMGMKRELKAGDGDGQVKEKKR